VALASTFAGEASGQLNDTEMFLFNGEGAYWTCSEWMRATPTIDATTVSRIVEKDEIPPVFFPFPITFSYKLRNKAWG
jgi:hypothetical protein